jgi:hypothetical protein
MITAKKIKIHCQTHFAIQIISSGFGSLKLRSEKDIEVTDAMSQFQLSCTG